METWAKGDWKTHLDIFATLLRWEEIVSVLRTEETVRTYIILDIKHSKCPTKDAEGYPGRLSLNVCKDITEL